MTYLRGLSVSLLRASGLADGGENGRTKAGWWVGLLRLGRRLVSWRRG